MWQPTDDYIGGAMVSGTFMVTGASARIEESEAPYLLLAQGMSVEKLYTLMLLPLQSGLFERDEVYVTFPPDHYLYNVLMRVISVTKDSLPRNNRGHWEVTLRRIVQGRYP